MRPWVMQAWFSTASCHLGSTRTLRMLKRFYWWIGMSICTRWWLRHYLKRQARKTSWLTVRWPVISMPLRAGPGIAVSVDYSGPLPIPPRCNAYILCRQSLPPYSQPRARPLGMPAQHTLGQRPPLLLKAFAGGLQASWSSENCHQLLPPK